MNDKAQLSEMLHHNKKKKSVQNTNVNLHF